jgi:hypothetical protein
MIYGDIFQVRRKNEISIPGIGKRASQPFPGSADDPPPGDADGKLGE